MASVFQRLEFKYRLTYEQKESFLKDIETYIAPDHFSNYTICNLYLDTDDSRLIRRSIEKPLYKEKMRIRSYGQVNEHEKVFVELKKKFKGIVYKRRVNMYLGEAMEYIEGEVGRGGQIEKEIDYFLDFYRAIEPKMYIAYDREAFHGQEDTNLRITFDDHIIWRDEDLSLSSPVYGEEIIGEDECLLEIKCSGSMPLWLTTALSRNKIYKSSFSKYGMAYTLKEKRKMKERV